VLAVSFLLGISADPNQVDRWNKTPMDDALRGSVLCVCVYVCVCVCMCVHVCAMCSQDEPHVEATPIACVSPVIVFVCVCVCACVLSASASVFVSVSVSTSASMFVCM